MMHPYVVATFVVGTVAVAYTAYLIYKELSDEPILVHNAGPNSNERAYTRGREGYQSSEEEDDLSVIGSEKIGLRRRRKKSNSQSIEEDEQELLDTYSYLSALEQEIERKKKRIADEERLISEKEQEIQNRKQHLQSVSSRSSSNTDLSPVVSQRRPSIPSSNTSASEIVVNDSHGQPVLTEGTFPIASNPPPRSVISIKTVSSEEEKPPIDNKSSDVAAQTILSQHLSHIRHQQQSPYHPDPSITIQNSDVSANLTKINPPPRSEHHDRSAHNEQTLYQLNHSPYVAKSIASEETWSEVESVLSENIESVMSSALDIDMDEVDVIEH